VTARVHGAEAVERATNAARILFGTSELASADADTIQIVCEEVPSVVVSGAELDEGIGVIDAFVRAGLAESKKQARQFAGSGSLSINDITTDGQEPLGRDHLLAGGAILLRRGKRQWAALRLGEAPADT